MPDLSPSLPPSLSLGASRILTFKYRKKNKSFKNISINYKGMSMGQEFGTAKLDIVYLSSRIEGPVLLSLPRALMCRVWVLSLACETCVEFPAPVFSLVQSQLLRHLGSEPVAERSLYISLPFQ